MFAQEYLINIKSARFGIACISHTIMYIVESSSPRNLRGKARDGLSTNRCFLWSASGCVHTFVLTLPTRTSRPGPLPLITSTTEYREVRYLLEKMTGGKAKRADRGCQSEIGACTKRAAALRGLAGQKGRRRETHGGCAGIFIQKIIALNPKRALLLNFTFLVRKRGPFHGTSKKSIMPRVRIVLV